MNTRSADLTRPKNEEGPKPLFGTTGAVFNIDHMYPDFKTCDGPKTCEHCRFWNAVSVAGLSAVGQCRINPPVDPGLWPIIGSTDWCGAFSPKPEPEVKPEKQTGSEPSNSVETEVPGEANPK